MEDTQQEKAPLIPPDFSLGPRRGKLTPAQEIENRFTYHKPFGTQPARYEAIRTSARVLASVIQTMCPDSREKSTAHTLLQQVVMQANASIAINEEEPTVAEE